MLLLPTALVLLAALPVAGIAALLVLVLRAPSTEPDSAHPHALQRTDVYST
ncbi:MAG TPA: hypothetical protein VFK02_01310 [Kofleriaceae bacterium]|nr:hypothetical protein [Kofleriaceae bacterium]